MLTRSLIAAVMLAGCGRIGFDGTDPIVLTEFRHRKEITLDPPATVATALPGFVVSIAEPFDPDLVAAARADGKDLVFTDSAGTVLPFEISGYDGATGALDAWVRLPTLANTAPTTLELYYGGPPTSVDPTTAWGPEFIGVWHMTDGSLLHDSTAGRHDVPPKTSASVPTATDGIAGVGLRYDGVDDGTSAHPVAADLEFGITSFSYSCWVLVPQSSGQYDMPIYHGGGSAPMPGYDMELGTTNWSGHISDGSRTVAPQFGAESQFLNKWVHLVAVVDRATQSMVLYTNGTRADSTNISTIGSVDAIEPFNIGQPDFVFHGVLDEVRVMHVALSPSWISAEHANLANRAAFVVIGPDQQLP